MIAKNKLAPVVAAVCLAVALAVAVWALASRGDHTGTAAAVLSDGATPTASATPAGATPSAKVPGTQAGGTAVPPAVVDPRKGRDYCDTVHLLGLYSQQGYGLDAKSRVVSGKQFDHRLVVIRDTYRQLVRQAASPLAAPKTVPAWTRLADATGKAENTLRAVVLNVQSQPMIVELAKLADTTRRQLPIATSGLDDTCGISPKTLGVG